MLEKLKETEEKVASGELAVTAYSKADAKNDRRAIYLRTLGRGLKTYKWTIILGVGTIGCFGMAFKIVSGRLVAMTSYAADLLADKVSLENAVISEYGEEKLHELRSKQIETVEEKHVDDKTGEEVVDNVTYKNPQVHTVLLDELFEIWNKNDPGETLRLLDAKLNTANHILFNRGYLLKNEFLEILGVSREHWTQDGQFVGWFHYKDPKEAEKHGAANFISVGLENDNDPQMRRFKQGLENTVWLTLNCDREPILDKIGWRNT